MPERDPIGTVVVLMLNLEREMLLEGQLLKALKIAMVAALLVVPVRLHAEDFSGGTDAAP